MRYRWSARVQLSTRDFSSVRDMAGTFVAMTSPAIIQWLSTVLPTGWIVDDAPVLRGITELGFALSFGVMLDTLIVRSILVPAFFVLWQRSDGLIADSEPPV